MTHVTCRLTAKNLDQLRNPTLGNQVLATCAFLHVQFSHILCILFMAVARSFYVGNAIRYVICTSGFIGDDLFADNG